MRRCAATLTLCSALAVVGCAGASAGAAASAGGVPSLSLLRERVGLTPLDVDVGEAQASGDSERQVVSLLLPSDQSALLDLYVDQEQAGAPYYGIVWPSAYALARHVAARENVEPLRGAAVLELGCGVGLAGIAAALTGAPRSVTLTDNDPLAVELSRLGAERSGVGGVCTCAVRDWTDLASWPECGYDCVLGADIIYESAACEAIAALLERTLRVGGSFVLADGRGRRNRRRLWELLLEGGGFELESEERHEAVTDVTDSPIEPGSDAAPVVLARFTKVK